MTRFFAIFRKSLKEQLRSPWELVLILLIGPMFVLLYWLFLGGGSTSYTLLVLNQDSPAADALVQSLREIAYPDGQPVLKLRAVTSVSEAEGLLRNRDAAALLVIPPAFSARVAAYPAQISGQPVVISGDLTNPTYAVAAVLATSAADEYVRTMTGQARPVAMVERPLGGSAARSEFEVYVPGLLVVAVVMMLFSAALRVTREVESGGFKRLALTHVTPLEYLAGVSAVQMLVGLSAVLMTFLSAVALGFRSQGPLWLAILVGGLSAFSVIGVGLMVAAFARTSTEAFIIANFPMVLLMFFSGGVFPLQRVPLFTLAGRAFALFDLLPQTHAVLALNKVLTLGAGLSEIAYELIMVFVLSLAYFGLGVWMFGKRAMQR